MSKEKNKKEYQKKYREAKMSQYNNNLTYYQRNREVTLNRAED